MHLAICIFRLAGRAEQNPSPALETLQTCVSLFRSSPNQNRNRKMEKLCSIVVVVACPADCICSLNDLSEKSGKDWPSENNFSNRDSLAADSSCRERERRQIRGEVLFLLMQLFSKIDLKPAQTHTIHLFTQRNKLAAWKNVESREKTTTGKQQLMLRGSRKGLRSP